MKKKIFKLLGTVFLVAAVILTQLPAAGVNAVSPSNNGFMMDGDKLVKYTGTATSVSVPNGVKTIGAEAFADNTALSYVTLPNSLLYIENGAFSGCRYLNRVIVPEGVRSIGNGAFADCENLSTVSLPASLTQMGTSVFAGCDDLKTIGIDKKNPDFVCEDGVLYNDDKTVIYQVLAGRDKKNYMMPNSVEEIKKYAFWGCENLESVGISGHVKRIDDYAFSNASGLKSITIPFSVRSIGTKAFEDCRNLVDVTIPVSVTKIDPTAFDGCYRLNVIADEGTTAADFFADFEANNASRAEYEDSVSANTNPHWVKDTEEKEKERESKVNVSDVENYVEWDVDSPGVLGRSKVVSRQAVIFMDASEGTVYNGTSGQGAGADTESTGGDEGTVSDSESVTEGNAIAYKAFYQDDSLLSFTFPGGIKSIGELAFARSGLNSIQIPYGVERIGNGAFYHCDDLAAVSIPSTVTEIEPDAFTYTKWMENWRTADINDFLVVGDGILLAYKGNASQVTIPSHVKRIAPGVFKDHGEISQVTVPESVRVIGEEAFLNCTGLTNISGGSAITEIRDRAFYGCPIETVRIPATVEKVGLMAFGGTDSTDSVVFLGSKLPKVSYEKSATRLSNDDYRNSCFDNISVAVVNADVGRDDLEDTVLDWKQPGFQGQIYVLNSDAKDPKAEMLSSTLPVGKTQKPDNIFVYGRKYQVTVTEKTSYPEEEPSVSDNSIQGLMVVDHTDIDKKDVEISANGSTVNLDGYHFYLSNPGLGESDLKKRIQNYYGFVNDDNYFAMDLSLYDPTDTIPIKKLGKNSITVTMPVPANLLDKEVCVISGDDNGNPEVTFCTWSEKDGREYISFDVEHFSPYVLYGAEGELKERIAQKRSAASNLSGLDDTPDTGDTLDIRMILIVGLIALGGFFLLLGFFKPAGLKRNS